MNRRQRRAWAPGDQYAHILLILMQFSVCRAQERRSLMACDGQKSKNQARR